MSPLTPLRAGIELRFPADGDPERGDDEPVELAQMKAYGSALDDETAALLLGISVSGSWADARTKLLRPIKRQIGRAVAAAGQARELHFFAAVELALFLSAQMAAAPVDIGAAAASLLAHHLLSLREADVSLDLGAGASSVAAALCRPGFLAALAACRGTDHAAGVLAEAAVEALRWLDPDFQITPETAAALAPVLTATLAAPSNCALNSQAATLRSCSAAALLLAVAQQPEVARPVLHQALAAAAEFLPRVDAAVGSLLHSWHRACGIGGGRSGADGAKEDLELGGDTWDPDLDLMASLCWNTLSGMLLLLDLSIGGNRAGSAHEPPPLAAAGAAADSIVDMLQHTLERLAATPQQLADRTRRRLLNMLAALTIRYDPLAAMLQLAAAGKCAQLFPTLAQALQCGPQHAPAAIEGSVLLARLIDCLCKQSATRPGLISPTARDVALCAGAALCAQTQLAQQLAETSAGIADTGRQAAPIDVQLHEGLEGIFDSLNLALVQLVAVRPQHLTHLDWEVGGRVLRALAQRISNEPPACGSRNSSFEATLQFLMVSTKHMFSEDGARNDPFAAVARRHAWHAGLAALAAELVKLLLAGARAAQPPPQYRVGPGACQSAWVAAEALLLEATRRLVGLCAWWPCLAPDIAARGGAAALCEALRVTLGSELIREAATSLVDWITSFCGVLVAVVAADGAGCGPLAYEGHPAEWAAAAAAITAAVPHQQRQARASILKVSRALAATPAGQAQAQRESVTAQAAADAAMQKLLQAVMVDPVLLVADQQTYERAAILRWLEGHTTSPVTGQPLSSRTLVPNHTLRSILHGLIALQV